MFVKGVFLYYGEEKFADPLHPEDADYFGIYLEDNNIPSSWTIAFKSKEEAEYHVILNNELHRY